jgi:hypothetical protein
VTSLWSRTWRTWPTGPRCSSTTTSSRRACRAWRSADCSRACARRSANGATISRDAP